MTNDNDCSKLEFYVFLNNQINAVKDKCDDSKEVESKNL